MSLSPPPTVLGVKRTGAQTPNPTNRKASVDATLDVEELQDDVPCAYVRMFS